MNTLLEEPRTPWEAVCRQHGLTLAQRVSLLGYVVEKGYGAKASRDTLERLTAKWRESVGWEDGH